MNNGLWRSRHYINLNWIVVKGGLNDGVVISRVLIQRGNDFVYKTTVSDFGLLEHTALCE